MTQTQSKIHRDCQSCPDFLCVAPSIPWSHYPSDQQGNRQHLKLSTRLFSPESSSGRILCSGKRLLLHICQSNKCRGPLPANRLCRRGYHHRFISSSVFTRAQISTCLPLVWEGTSMFDLSCYVVNLSFYDSFPTQIPLRVFHSCWVSCLSCSVIMLLLPALLIPVF